jgi:hypothetical protein
MALGTFEEQLARAEDRVGAPAGFDLPGDAGGGVWLGQEIDFQFRGRGLRRFPGRARVVALIPSLIRPAAGWAIASGTRSAARAVARGTIGAGTTAVAVAAWRGRTPPFGPRPTRTAIVTGPRTVSAVAGLALVIGIAIGRWAFFHPVGQKFQIEFQWRITHRLGY